jgi:hypothetical protein
VHVATKKVTDVAIAIFAPSLRQVTLVLMAPKVSSNRTGFYKPFGNVGFVGVTFQCRLATIGRLEPVASAATANAYSRPQGAVH